MQKEKLVKLLESLDVKFSVLSKGVQLSCLFAEWKHERGTDRHPSMVIYYGNTSTFFCYSCKSKGTLVELFEEAARRDEKYLKYINIVREEEVLNISIPQDSFFPDKKQKEQQDLENLKTFIDICSTKQHNYIFSRNFTSETLGYWHIGFDEKKCRVTIPIYDCTGKFVGCTGRHIDSNHPVRYLQYIKQKAQVERSILLGENHINRGSIALLVEGALTVVKVWQFLCQQKILNYFTPLALMSSSISEKQIEKLIDNFSYCVLALDNDQPGIDAKLKIKRRLERKLTTGEIKYEEVTKGLDPDQIIDNYPQIFLDMLNKPKF